MKNEILNFISNQFFKNFRFNNKIAKFIGPADLK